MRGFLLLLSILTFAVAEVHETDDVALLKEGLKKLFTTGVTPRYFKDVAKKHQLDVSFFESPTLLNVSASNTCELCDMALGLVINLGKNIVSEVMIRKLALTVCEDFKIEDERICKGLLGPEMDIIFYIIQNGKDVKSEKFCSLLLGTSCHNQFEYFNWSIEIPPRPTKIPEKIGSSSAKNIRILQVTDFHYDPRYTPGAKAVCSEVLCCQDDQGTADNPDEACGVWGDYRKSDTPKRLLEEVLRHMRTQDVDFVYFTGDIISHRVWSTSSTSNSEVEREIMDMMKRNFDVPVLFVLGNHEPHPVNAYAPVEITKKKLSSKWLFQQLADELKGFISNEDLKNVENGGFYTTVLRPGFRVIVLNNNVCNLKNLWQVYDSYDPYGQLTWLVKILEEAERNGEYVHILHHIPTGADTCLGAWTREFLRIINRFSETISGQFNGHTHSDEFFLYFNESDPTDAIHAAFNGASVATFSSNNPSYKIYDIDPRNYEVADFEEWTFDLTAANLQPEKSTVDWYKLYSFKETYGVSTMQPKELYELVTKMAKDNTLLEIYHKYRYRMGTGANGYCDDNCHKSLLCKIVTSNLADTEHCEAIMKVYDENRNR